MECLSWGHRANKGSRETQGPLGLQDAQDREGSQDGQATRDIRERQDRRGARGAQATQDVLEKQGLKVRKEFKEFKEFKEYKEFKELRAPLDRMGSTENPRPSQGLKEL